MTTVYMHNWVNGEYKHCSNINANNHDEPFLMCDDAKLDDESGKIFNVRFYGRTHHPELRSATQFDWDWDCRRDNDSEPMFVCRRPVRSDRNNSTQSESQAPPQSPPPEIYVSPGEMDSLRKRNSCEARFIDKGIYDVNGMSPEAACKENPNRVPK